VQERRQARQAAAELDEAQAIVRELVDELAAGANAAAARQIVAEEVGISEPTVRRLYYGQRAHVTPEELALLREAHEPVLARAAAEWAARARRLNARVQEVARCASDSEQPARGVLAGAGPAVCVGH
jgi:hypothetical protein